MDTAKKVKQDSEVEELEEEKEDIEEEDNEEEEKKEEIEPEKVKFHGFNPNEQNSSQIFYEPPKKSGSMKKFIIWLIVLSILATVVGFLATTTFKSNEQETTEASPAPIFSPTPTPVPQLIRSDWSFEVLNGSGISGQAKKIADQIKELGYQVIKTGNADKQTYTESQILVSNDLKEKVDLVIADLKDIIKIATVAGELKDSTASARIILGKDSE
ncbi:LytR C-terminal domain-containing protein [Candidatus Daviesbacteria bacterium]|nr:LytR C-terminal domain-containing protein [Candidatus Daviesbacteria bacterium]